MEGFSHMFQYALYRNQKNYYIEIRKIALLLTVEKILNVMEYYSIVKHILLVENRHKIVFI